MSHKYVKLATTGDNMPTFGFGTWKVSEAEAPDAVYNAIKCGYRLIDCAALYNNEKGIGVALKRAIDDDHLVSRSDLFITSKLANNKHAAKDVEPACRQTLAELGVEYLDLYLMHWPYSREFGQDPATFVDVPIKETWCAMEDLVRKGLVRNIGVSNFTIKKLRSLLEYASVRPAVNQVELHPMFQQRPLVEFCRENGIAVNAYRPLCFAGDGKNLVDNQVIKKIAEKNGKTPAQIILRWGVQLDYVVIPKSVKPERMVENIGVYLFELDDSDMAEIGKLDAHFRTCTASTIFGNMTEEEFWDNE